MTTTSFVFSCDRELVKSLLSKLLSEKLDALLDSAEADASSRDLEIGAWKMANAIGSASLAELFVLQARRVTEKDIEARGLDPSKVRLRLDRDYSYCMTTTFGQVVFPLSAYRNLAGGSPVVRNPAAEKFKLHRRCRSSELCLEFETRVGSNHPFRTAQEDLRYFTHGAVTTEDTTIATHTTKVGLSLHWSWTYRTVENIRETLRTVATRDATTGRPIICVSSDAHALRRYADSTYNAQWKMANGVRIWCENRDTGEIVHLGGEYTWGDCNEVEAILRRLIDSGHLPSDGNYGGGVVAHVAWITDGAPWLEERIQKLFPTSRMILDVYHVIERVATVATAAWGKGHPQAHRFNRIAYEAIFGAPRLPKEKPKARRGHKKQPRAETMARRRRLERRRHRNQTTGARLILDFLANANVPKSCIGVLMNTLRYISNNAHRMDYARYIQEGYQVGSGAMESLHRVGSQIRLKRSGSGWLPETAQAIFNLRMMALVDRWDEFWSQPDLTDKLVMAFDGESSPIAA